MARIDFTPYRRSTVGFDHLFDLLESSVRNSGDNYPPFNIEKRGDDDFRITLALAGFKPEDIDITAQQNLLTVTGRKQDEARSAESEMLHVGIANRARLMLGEVALRRGDLGRLSVRQLVAAPAHRHGRQPLDYRCYRRGGWSWQP